MLWGSAGVLVRSSNRTELIPDQIQLSASLFSVSPGRMVVKPVWPGGFEISMWGGSQT